MIIGILLAQAIAFSVLSAIVASNKNRDPFGWSTLGFLFGLFGFIAAIAVGEVEQSTRSSRRESTGKNHQSSSKQKRQRPSTQEFNPDEHEKKCPDCAEYIKLEARVCKHCGYRFSEEEVQQQIEEVKEEEVVSSSGEPPKAENPKKIREKL